MSKEKRTVLFFILSFLILIGSQPLLQMLGLVPPPPAVEESEEAPADQVAFDPAHVPAFAGEPDGVLAFAPEGPSEPAIAPVEEVAKAKVSDEVKPVAEKPPQVDRVAAGLLVLGEADPKAKPDQGYRMRVDLAQRGAGVIGITLAEHAAEPVQGQPRDTRLQLLQAAEAPIGVPPPFALSLILPDPEGDPEKTREFPLDDQLWEVVPDDQGALVRPVPADPKDGLLEGQAIAFRTSIPELGVTVTKTYTLRKGRDAFRLGLSFVSDTPRELSYRLQGPHGLPIEGEWYTSNFREVFFGKVNGQATEIETHQATEIVKKEREGDPIRITTLPLKYTGVENQYFAVFFEPDPLPRNPDQRVDERTVATAIEVPPKEEQKADVSVAMFARPFTVSPNGAVSQSFRVFAGPKTEDALRPYEAEDLATYRKGWNIWVIGPASSFMARYVITPLLDKIYGLTSVVAHILGFERGSFGIAIILLTITVRLALFPLSRKQASSAKKMQDLQPQLTALREKYKDDKEKIGRETMDLYRQHGVNPMGGCLLALIQMPIFFGLWQALNNTVALRGARFLWIDNLAAPDQLFAFPTELPFLGPYFNLLPFLVVGLMLVHMKLFSPPATTPEQEMSQKMMKYMMVVMAFFFYRVPSGLGIYFITSSSWAIAERLLLPKELRTYRPAPSPKSDEGGGKGGPGGKPAPPPGGKPAPASTGTGNGKGNWRDRLREKLDEVMEEASKDRTHRNVERDKDRKGRPRPRPGKRR